MSSTGLHEPSALDEFYFQWHITERCNKACKHCYQEEERCPELSLLDLERILNLIDEALTKWGKRGSLSITGGEPFVRRAELFSLARDLDSRKSVETYDILSNGSLITEQDATDLATLAKLRRLQVSLEGATPETNDTVRGDGSFEQTLDAIRLLKRHGLTISVMTTVSRLNSGEIPQLIRLLDAEGVDAFALERLIPEGKGKGLKQTVLPADELRALYEAVYQVSAETRVRLLLYRPLFALVAPEDPTVGALCSAGNNALTVMPDGTVYPCRRLPIPIGNILRDGLYRIWYGSDVLWDIRNPDKLVGKCRSCDLLARCRGCRATAYFCTGDYMAEEPQCWR